MSTVSVRVRVCTVRAFHERHSNVVANVDSAEDANVSSATSLFVSPARRISLMASAS